MEPHLLATSALLPFIGFLLGYILSILSCLNGRKGKKIQDLGKAFTKQYVQMHQLNKELSTMKNIGEGRCSRTVSMETGCQNVQLCSTILNVTFPPEVIGPLFFFPLLYMIFQVGEGLLLIAIFRCYEKIKSSKDKTKMIYRVDTSEETIPTALGNGTHKGECSPQTA